jgi:hypothetical protein
MFVGSTLRIPTLFTYLPATILSGIVRFACFDEQRMRIGFSFLIGLYTFYCVSQDAVIPLPANPALGVKQMNTSLLPDASRHQAQGRYIVEADPKNLPFVDDFSSAKQRTFDFPERYVYDSILYASGPCLQTHLIATITGRFHILPSWNYTYNLITQQVDSTPKMPITFRYFTSTGTKCLDVVSYTYQFYPEYYRYTFNTTTGEKIDSQLVTDDAINPDTLIDYAPVLYRSKADPKWLWIDNFAFINSTYPIFPPTIGVATLDGLNEYGRPHDPFIQPNSYGNADYLTSVPLNLGGLTEADSLYLSFFYQPMGLGDYPDKNDSLVVEFKNEYTDKWDVVWKRGGYNNIPSGSEIEFKQVLIPFPAKQVPIKNYFYNGFQFRFRNKASITGNNDHWHIDYVRLDKNRSINDTVIEDIAIIQPASTILKNYYTMPADQFIGSDDLSDTFHLYVRNLNFYNNNAPATNFQGFGIERFPANTSVYNAPIQTFNAGYSNTISRNPKSDFTMPPALGNTDSVSLFIKEWISPLDIMPGNDTVTATQIFYNELAYDDGTAEKAYGLFGDPGKVKKFAYEFNLNKTDTLTGFKIFFTNIDENVSNLVFQFNIWDTIALQQFNPPPPIWESSNTTPQYIDSTNGFAVYRLDTALVVNRKIYFGWTQDDFRNLQIGYDRNSTRGCGKYYIYTNATWKKSNICQTMPGSVMIHLLFGDMAKINPTNILDLRKEKWEVQAFPNPTGGRVHLEFSKPAEYYEIKVFDLYGHLKQSEIPAKPTLALEHLPPGLYLLQIKDNSCGSVTLKKIIKN